MVGCVSLFFCQTILTHSRYAERTFVFQLGSRIMITSSKGYKVMTKQEIIAMWRQVAVKAFADYKVAFEANQDQEVIDTLKEVWEIAQDQWETAAA